MGDVDFLNADFARSDPDAFARILARGDAQEAGDVLARLPSAAAALVVSRLPAPQVQALLETGEDMVMQWLLEAPVDDALALLGRAPRERSLALVNSLRNAERKRRFLRYLRYPTHSVGALVADVPLRFAANVPARDVLEELRASKNREQDAAAVVLLEGRYFGLLDLWKLLAKEPLTGTARDYVDRVPPMHAETPVASVIANPHWHAHNWLAVVDHEQRVLGGVSRASVFAAIQQHGGTARNTAGVLNILLGDMLMVSGELFDRMLARKVSS